MELNALKKLLAEILESQHPVDVAASIEEFKDEDILLLLNMLPAETLATIFEEASESLQQKIVEFLDAHNGYASLSPTDEKIFRNILSDNKLKKEEAYSLSYEQVERIAKLLTLSRCSGDEWKKTAPVVFSDVDLKNKYQTI